MRRSAIILLATLTTSPLAAQQRDSVDQQTPFNVYHFIVDVDVPESPALVELDLSPTRVLRAAAPKPVAVHVLHTTSAGRTRNAVSVDVAPYYYTGGGVRTLESYKRNGFGWRLMRVLTKTLFSLAITQPDESGVSGIGFGVRSTIHDPHDPVLNLGLADSVIAAIHATGQLLPVNEGALAAADVDVAQLFNAARRDMRMRCCVQIALGWSGAVYASELSRAASTRVRHQFWGTFQITQDQYFDYLITPRLLDLTGDPEAALGVGVQRKGEHLDVRLELNYTTRGDWQPGVAVEAGLIPGLGVVASFMSESNGDADHAAFRLLGRWYFAHRP